ncbi:MAG: hypothetical protein OEV49_10530 [candidate division Zixibacteria bacterium]|nr:hypothetical protein [candidate division Zixibacteria bacterium]MDH3936331.1 hypothetical protein [candidate division Zixibacteria bacterium]MDH4035307.1 hypothetical protein [candidate division Zixibacteria bacterium]
MEKFLALFENAIKKQAELVGEEIAFQQAKKAGLGVSPEGHIVSCTGHPQLVLLRLIKYFTAGGNLLALVECMALINELVGNEVNVVEDGQAAKAEQLQPTEH